MNTFQIRFYILIIFFGLLIPENAAIFDRVKNILSLWKRDNMTMDENDDVFLDILIHRAKRSVQKPECDEKQINSYLVDMGITNYDAIIFLLISTDLDGQCKKLEPVLVKAKQYLRTCHGRNDEHIDLVSGAEEFTEIICKDTVFRKDLDSHEACLASLKNDLANCAGSSEFGSERYKKDICCAYAQLTNCLYIKVDTACGEHAVRAIERAILRIINKILPMFCATTNQDCDVPDVASQLQSNVMLVSLANVLFYVIMKLYMRKSLYI